MSEGVKDRINIEYGCPIFIEINEQRKKLASKIVGLEHKEYIIIRSPAGLGGVLGKLNPGKIFVVKYVYRGIAYGFKTHVLTSITSPASLLFIDYPKLVVEQGLRAENRYKCYLNCSVKTADFESRGAVVDISMGGCCFTIPAREAGDQPHLMTVGSDIEITLKKPGSKERIPVTGSIGNVIESNDTTRVGVSFKELSGKVKNELKQIMLPLFTI